MTERQSLRVVLADDEELGRAHLRAYINAMNRAGDVIEIVGEAANGNQAVEVVAREQPDVLFLDVSMPDLDGVGVVAELAAKVPDELPWIVFVTAYDAAMVQTLNLTALDHLQKPLSRERFAQAVTRARDAGTREAAAGQRTRVLAWLAAKT